MDLEARFSRSEDFVYRKVGAEDVLVPIMNDAADLSHIYVLNDTAAFIWEALDGDRTVGDIKEKLLAEYDVDEQAAIESITELLSDLSGIGAVHKAD